MDERSNIPPGLPQPHPTSSYWQNPPSRLANWQGTKLVCQESEFPTDVDVVVIGSGITGATVAFNILKSGCLGKVLMLEARTACSGATGRNGGHTKPHVYREFLPNVKAMGEEEAAKIARFKYKCMKATHAFARKHSIDCESWEGDTVDIFYNIQQFNEATKAIETMRSILGEDDEAAQFRIWNSLDTERVFKVNNAYGAVSYGSGSINAYKFVTGLLELALSKGLELWTETPVNNIRSIENGDGRKWSVHTSRGIVRGDKVVVATNGYAAHLCPTLQGTIVPLRGHMTAQRPGSKLLAGSLHNTYSFIYEDGYEYMIPRPLDTDFAGDICIGGGLTKAPEAGLKEYGNTDDTTTDSDILKYLESIAADYFGPQWGDDDSEGRNRQSWTGVMGYSADGFPLVGQLPSEHGLYVSASFQGSGMVISFLSAKALVLMMEGKDDDALQQWLPKTYRIGKNRIGLRFRGRLNTIAPAQV